MKRSMVKQSGWNILAGLLVLILAACSATADVRPPVKTEVVILAGVFCDHMVLQRDKQPSRGRHQNSNWSRFDKGY